MLKVSFIRENKERVTNGLLIRNWKSTDLGIIDEILDLDNARRSTQKELDDLLNHSNVLSKKIGELYREGKREEADKLKLEVSGQKETVKHLQDRMAAAKLELESKLLLVPNTPHPSVPKGISDEDNEIYQEWSGALPVLPESAVPHWDIASKLNIIDFDLGAKITGSGFPLYRGNGARLQRALTAFFLDEAQKSGYEEILPPFLVNEASARGTGQIPDKEGQMYHVQEDELYIIPTAEVPITNIYRDVLLAENAFPIKMCGYTPCFRREAGSYGKDVRGLNRVHQFDKVEIVRIEHPDKSADALQEMLQHVTGLLKKLELPYRISRLCGGDLGFASSLTFDFEVYAAAQKKWLEVSSVSNFETFQSNRMMLRYRDAENKTHLAHTLNGSALALARIYAAILENNQKEDGSIKIPEALIKYTGFDQLG